MTPPFLSNGKPLDLLRAAMAEGRQPVPLGKTLGFRAVELEPGRCVVELEIDERHGNVIGTLHGGVPATLADSAMGFAFAATLEAGELCTTVELKINFLRPCQGGKIRATGRLVKRGRNLGYLECDIEDEGGQLLSRASSTYMVLR